MIFILQYQLLHLVQYRTIIVEIFINYYYYYKLGHFHNKKNVNTNDEPSAPTEE